MIRLDSTEAAACSQAHQRLITEVADGSRSVDRSWHVLRKAKPSLEVWRQFAAASRKQGRRYDNKWAHHQWLCWTCESTEGTYAEQRAQWAIREAKYVRDMGLRASEVKAAKTARAPIYIQPAPVQLELLD